MSGLDMRFASRSRRSARPAMGWRCCLLALLVLAAVRTATAQRRNQREDDSSAFVEDGRAALQAGRLADAARSFDQALLLDPGRIQSYILRARVHRLRREFRSGIELMRRAQARAPSHLGVLAELGAQLLLSGQVELAVPMLDGVLRRDARLYETYLVFAEHWRRVGQFRRAIVALRGYLRTRPTEASPADPGYTIDLADSYLRAGFPRRAMALLQDPAVASHPRAPLAQAWALAAIDCQRASTRIAAIDPDRYPEILLVAGRCAVASGDRARARGLARRFLAAVPQRGAAAHALLADVYQADGDLKSARREYDLALSQLPGQRTWTVRRASVLRRQGAFTAAIDQLVAIGAPPAGDADPSAWWLEMGQSLLGKGDLAELIAFRARLAPLLQPSILPGPIEPLDQELFTPPAPRWFDAASWRVLGEVELALGSLDAAISSLQRAQNAQPSATASREVQALLDRAIAELAVRKLNAREVDAAIALLTGWGKQRSSLEPGPLAAAMWRNLGIAHLLKGKGKLAVIAFDRSSVAEVNAITLMLLARAWASVEELDEARTHYQRAAAIAAGADRVEVALDWSTFELRHGAPTQAAEVFQHIDLIDPGGVQGQRYRDARRAAYHAAGVLELRAGNPARALQWLKIAEEPGSDLALRCNYALALMLTQERDTARSANTRLQQSCPFASPQHGQAQQILLAALDGQSAKRAAAVLATLKAMKPSKGNDELLAIATRQVAINAAQEAYRKLDITTASSALVTARSARTKVGEDEVTHNTAVVELWSLAKQAEPVAGTSARIEAVITILERLGQQFPEALVNLGVLYDRQRQSDKALELWRRARRAGVRFSPLPEWIIAKERMIGSEPVRSER